MMMMMMMMMMMTTMIMLTCVSCTSVDYCEEFISCGAAQHVMQLAVSYSGHVTSDCGFDWSTMDDDADADVAVATMRLLDVLCKASRATASLVCGTGVLDACMRWLFVLPPHRESPVIHSLLLLWHTCSCYGIATNAFTDVAHKLADLFRAGHHAHEVELLLCACVECDV